MLISKSENNNKGQRKCLLPVLSPLGNITLFSHSVISQITASVVIFTFKCFLNHLSFYHFCTFQHSPFRTCQDIILWFHLPHDFLLAILNTA